MRAHLIIAVIAILNYVWNTSGNIHRNRSFIYTRLHLGSYELESFGYPCKIFHVFANDMDLSKSSLPIRIYDLNVCPTLNSRKFKSNFSKRMYRILFILSTIKYVGPRLKDHKEILRRITFDGVSYHGSLCSLY